MKETYHKQKILFICQNFWPENFRSTDVVNNLINSGNYVEVLTSNPNYPEGKIYKGYKWNNFKTEKYKNKFLIHRVPTIPRGNSNYFFICLNYLSFIIFGVIFGIFKLRNKNFDVIFVFASSPIFQVFVGYFLKKIKRAKMVTWVQDLWPENLVALNIIQSRVLLKLVNLLTTFTYNLSDILIAQSKSFEKVLRKRSKRRVIFLPNYAEIFDKKKIIKKKNKKFVILYAGNIGKAQKLITLLKAANKLKNKPGLLIKIFGDGVDLNYLKKFKKEKKIKNVLFFGKVSNSQILTEYRNANVLYLSLTKNKFLNYTIPAKLQTYFFISKPIIASAGGEIKNIIIKSNVGYCSEPENTYLLVKNIKKMINCNINKIKKFEYNSRKYYLENFETNLINRKLNKILYNKK